MIETTRTTHKMTWQQCNVRCSSFLLPSLVFSCLLLSSPLFSSISLNSDSFLLPSPLISSLLHDTLLLFHTRVSIQNFRRVSIQTCFRCPCSSHRLSAQVSILKNFIVFSPKFVQCLFRSSKQHMWMLIPIPFMKRIRSNGDDSNTLYLYCIIITPSSSHSIHQSVQ